ncbi:MAG: glycosyltransferase family 4 protein [Gemmatimonadota bacterium]
MSRSGRTRSTASPKATSCWRPSSTGPTRADPDRPIGAKGRDSALRILFLDSWLRDRAAGSGSAVAIAGLARGLERLGHSVDALRPSVSLPSLDLTRLAYNLGLRSRLEGAAGRYDLVVGFDIDGFALPRSIERPYVVALKGVAAEERQFEAGWQRIRFDLIRRAERRNARKADRVYVTSEYAAEAARRAYGLDEDRLHVVPEALDEAVRERAAAAGAPHLERRGPFVLSVARQYRRKDTPTLLRAFRRVLRDVPEARLRIVGDGPELPSSRRLAARLDLDGRVVFTGSLSTAEALDEEYRRARVFCLPSRQEGFGIVFLEAMAYGLPIAAVEAAAVPEVAPHGETSLLSAPGDAEALAVGLVRLLTDDALARRLGSGGPPRASRFTWPASARAFIDGLR